MADLTAHLHAQLARHGYRGAPFRYVYVDEVQDLTPAQIALFRWVSTYAELGCRAISPEASLHACSSGPATLHSLPSYYETDGPCAHPDVQIL